MWGAIIQGVGWLTNNIFGGNNNTPQQPPPPPPQTNYTPIFLGLGGLIVLVLIVSIFNKR